ncbi:MULTISPECIES: IS200/IS605 family transposase [unclassified Spirosoma]|uniref:IS200/IS605 family transposase n=1 Tax=unclassified Spirosoma TaxID=2621999 RepID=UPI0009608971|nr:MULTISPECIES: IS200/IS605 family transposase [unclassified Spirosoma]MBN8825779.1 IS200/IS605 family transposase [Spirosoma sp.]OJW74374.1 MAG: transposase [Spirosoma sp. 48-14]
MANTYTQLDIQLVFAVKGRESLIEKSWKEELYRYITSIVQNHNHKLLAINGMPDHIHIFIGYNPAQLLPKLVEEIKTSSNKHINTNRLSRFPFSWQAGYGAFSYSRSQRADVIRYIDRQEEHHRRKSFGDEYRLMLQKFEVDYKEAYLFEFLENIAE